MKTRFCLRIAATSSAFVLLGACAMFQKPSSAALVGTWTNSIGAVWTISADGTFEADINHDGKGDAWGSWSVTGDEMTLQRSGGTSAKPAKGCEGKGIYRFRRAGDTLQFAVVSDACKLRRKNVLLTWHRK